MEGDREVSGIQAILLAVVRAGIAVSSGARFARAWIAVATDTMGLSSSSHHLCGISMVGGRISSNRSLEKVTFLKDTGRRSMPHKTLIWRGGTSTMIRIARSS